MLSLEDNDLRLRKFFEAQRSYEYFNSFYYESVGCKTPARTEHVIITDKTETTPVSNMTSADTTFDMHTATNTSTDASMVGVAEGSVGMTNTTMLKLVLGENSGHNSSADASSHG